ncbi:hypothetical protein FACS1894178_5650 [Bacteroidia bacterium]|nr:hypothetical protein FACS1894178_5650 [Bacteroidia bacterium]
MNDKLIPLMLLNGFPLDGCRFEWNDSYDFSPEEMFKIESLLLNAYNIDAQYFIDKYGIPILGKKELPALAQQLNQEPDFFA